MGAIKNLFSGGGASTPKVPDLPPPPPPPPTPQDKGVKDAQTQARRVAAASAIGAADNKTGAQGLEFTPANLIRNRIVLGA